MLLPHKLWASMYSFDQELFLQHFLGGNDRNASKFWKSMGGSKLADKLALLQLDPRMTIPMKLFGDGIACTGISKSWAKTADTFLISSMLATSKVSEVLGEKTSARPDYCH